MTSTLSFQDGKVRLEAEVDLSKQIEELEEEYEHLETGGLSYEIRKCSPAIPGEPALEIVIAVNWADVLPK
jgi:hypothetical protein